jgi:hypothetical protein
MVSSGRMFKIPAIGICHHPTMGSRNWMLAFSDADAATILRERPALDHVAAQALAERLYPDRMIMPIEEGTLGDNCAPAPDELYLACYPGLTIICTMDAAVQQPSELAQRLRNAAPARDVHLHATHSVVDAFSYGFWRDGQLRRSLAMTADDGIVEDIGDHLPFEAPFWAGDPPSDAAPDDDYPLPFHPLDLAEAAMRDLLGFGFEGEIKADDPDPFDLPVAGFTISRQSGPTFRDRLLGLFTGW